MEHGDYIRTRESLLSRLKDWGDEQSWQDFYETYWRLIYNVALKAGLTKAEAQDVLQETVVEVAAKIKEFRYNPERGRFKGWLLQLTRWRIADEFRRRERTNRGKAFRDPSQENLREGFAEPVAESTFDELWESEWKNNLMAAAQQKVRERVAPRTFQCFELTVLKGWEVTRAAQALGISRAQVYLAKHRVAAALKGEIEKLRGEFE